MPIGATPDDVLADMTVHHMIAVGVRNQDLCMWDAWVLPSVHQAASSS